ncbi:MAG: hypothetical protein PHT60_16065 [Acidiphilium sp.]|nr:hypothetical protein [Acidiphilium sp.]MDD4937280.1 hypothetical protein [Acidiphilium sp.]
MDLFDTAPFADKIDTASAISASLERASGTIARLDQAVAHHKLRPAFLYRARLIAVRRQAAVDGQLIEPWHLAALLEGLRLRMDPDLSPYERGSIFEAARTALGHYQWLTAPDFDQEGEIQQALRAIDAHPPQGGILLHAAHAAHQWLDTGGTRPPLRGALVRFWQKTRLIHAPIPLTGPQALGGDVTFARPRWIALFLQALAVEAEEGLDLLRDLERAWLAARSTVAARRRNSRAAMAVDLLAAAPLISATTLAARLGMATNNATALLREFEAAGIVIDVSHRAKRKLFGLAGLERLRDHVAPPRRPQPGRARGRPRLEPPDPEPTLPPDLPPVAAGPAQASLAFDYSDLEDAMAAADLVIRDTRARLDRLRHQAGSTAPSHEPEVPGPADDHGTGPPKS